MNANEQIILKLARLDPDFPKFEASFPADVLRQTGAPLPDGLADDIIVLLKNERSDLGTWLDAQACATEVEAEPAQMAIDPLAAAGVLAAIVFLLGSYIEYRGNKFRFIKKPTDSEILMKILDKLMEILKF